MEMALGVARGMAAMEAARPPLLHRDLKPTNIFIGAPCWLPSMCVVAAAAAGACTAVWRTNCCRQSTVVGIEYWQAGGSTLCCVRAAELWSRESRSACDDGVA